MPVICRMVAAGLACLLSAIAYAAGESFITLDYEEFSSSTATCIAQDDMGFIWAGSQDGLYRFDGKKTRHYVVGQTPLENIISAIYTDDTGLIWIGTEAGIFIYDNKADQISKFTVETDYGVNISCRVNVLSADSRGNLLVGTNGQGLFIYDRLAGNLMQHSRHASMIKALCCTGGDRLIVGSEEGTVSEFMADGTFIRTLYEDSKASEARNTDISALYAEGLSIWVGFGQKGFCHIDKESSASPDFLYPSGMSGALTVKSILPISENELLIGAQNGLFVFNAITAEFSIVGKTRDFPFFYNVNDLFKDRDGGIWVATQNNGLTYIYSPSNIFTGRLGTRENGLSTMVYTTSFCEDAKGNIWIGTLESGLMKVPMGQGIPRKTNIDIPNIKCLMADGDDIWIGSASDGIFVYNTVSGSMKNYHHNRFDQTSVSDNCINVLFKASNGRIYVGTEWGLGYFNRENGTFRLESRASNKTHVSDIFEDSGGNIWIATHNEGVYRVGLDGKNWKSFQNAQNIPGIFTNHIHEDFGGRVWIATSSGLCWFDSDSSSFHTEEYFSKFLKGKNILSIEQDYHGRLWLSLPFSLCCLDPESRAMMGTFDKSDGLQCHLFENNCSLRTSSGRMLFGGQDGYDEFNPMDFTFISGITGSGNGKVVITDIIVNNSPLGSTRNRRVSKPAYMTDAIKLSHSANSIAIDFSVFDYRSPDKIHYMYMLDGRDKEWTDAGNSPSAVFNNLKPGRYVFRARAYGINGLQKSGETSLSITILPPFYMTGWAFAIYTLVLAGMMSFVSAYLSKRRKQQSYAAMVDFYTNITHEIRTPLTLIKVPLEKILSSGDGNEQTRNYLGIIRKNTDNMLNLINQLLDYRKGEDENYRLHLESTNIVLLLSDIASRFSILAESEGKTLEFETDTDTAIYTFDREAMSKIVNNLLSNAVKYSNNLIKVTLVSEISCYRIKVFNDGAQIASDEKEKIFKMFYQVDNSKAGTGIGLPLARMLAEKHGGTVTVSSEKEGTVFEIYIPAQRQAAAEPATEKETFSLQETEDAADEENRYTILIVDDNDDLRALVAELLKGQYNVVQAGGGKEGMDILEKYPVDLILCDVVMPDMDGNEFCEYVKSDIRYANIPFVHISVNAKIEDKIKGLEYGADDYIEKPFSPDFLMSKIKTLLDNRKRLMSFYRGLPVVHPKQVSSITRNNVEFIRKLNEEIMANLSNEKYDVEMLAKNLYLSQSSLYRKMKSLLGMSPNEYLKDFRLQKAAEMLSSGKYLVSDVYALTGFSSVSYFSICFKKKFGVSATGYIESIKKGDSRK